MIFWKLHCQFHKNCLMTHYRVIIICLYVHVPCPLMSSFDFSLSLSFPSPFSSLSPPSHYSPLLCLFPLLPLSSLSSLLSPLSLSLLQSLLDEPNPNSPANSLAAQLYQENRREYEKKVQAIVEESWMNVWQQTSCMGGDWPHPLLSAREKCFMSYNSIVE